ncbi:GDSL-like Lipase/Acylhydrolase family protein [Cyclonatronum proteinivorum]|uniref:GDSL-like Lipase/Acylhydrolase family protein n=1 Tax=Cyclonatronum proteinivorum TaxID=1457365 RepID=A0A345UI72_9BACT|nr:SGNH/GDSL hydrolase family protein [Cyclonatronum proteinivorum]AXJ00174.1 GDSL-like Lipase/Acylhydrolase family protein [Cyclonatronum proteinivorum]
MALTTKQKRYIQKHAGTKPAGRIAADLKMDESEVRTYLAQLNEKEGVASSGPAGSRKILFYSIMLAIPLLFFVLLEAGLRMGNYRGDLSLFVYPQSLEGRYAVPNPNFTGRYFFRTATLPSPADDVFLTQKPENGFRVFVLGGSTANGYPYGFNGSFSRSFRDMLQDMAPDRHVEVVNVATSAINSYSIYDQIPELLNYKPDAILIYAGHNEYYGALGVASSETFGAFPGFVRAYLRLQRFRTFMLLRDGIVRLSGVFASGSGAAGSGTLMQRMVGEQLIPLDSELYELGRLQFESNLNAIMRRLERANVPVFIGTLTSNLKDHHPFLSVETDAHPRADVVFAEAQQAYEAGDFERAFERFLKAKELDALRFRAPESFNEIIRTTAARFANAHTIPVHEAFKRESAHQLIGFNLMTEHLHPNIPGFHLMARTFMEGFKAAGLPSIDLQTDRLQSWEQYVQRMELTEFDHRVGEHRVKLLMNAWPFVEQRDPRGYPRNYRFTSEADSVAFMVVNEGQRWDQSKVELAGIYEQQGRFSEALAEYRGLMRAQPFNDSPFIFAARVWLGLDNFEEARPLLEHALEIEASAFTTRMLGAIEVDAGNLERGISLLTKSLALEPNDPQTLFNLSGAHGLKRDFQKADEMLRRLEQINPNFPGAQAWRRQLNQHLSRN